MKSMQQIIKEIAEKYGVQYEIAEQIIKEYINIQYYSLTGKEINEGELFDF